MEKEWREGRLVGTEARTVTTAVDTRKMTINKGQGARSKTV